MRSTQLFHLACWNVSNAKYFRHGIFAVLVRSNHFWNQQSYLCWKGQHFIQTNSEIRDKIREHFIGTLGCDSNTGKLGKFRIYKYVGVGCWLVFAFQEAIGVHKHWSKIDKRPVKNLQPSSNKAIRECFLTQGVAAFLHNLHWIYKDK